MTHRRVLYTTAFMLGAVLLGVGSVGAESTFQKSQMYVVEGKKMMLRNVTLTFNDSALLIRPAGKATFAERTIPYTRVKNAVYEFSSERRWGAAVIVSPLFLLSKSKKHWFTLVCKAEKEADAEEEVVFRLDKSNYANILDTFEKSSGTKIRMEASKD